VDLSGPNKHALDGGAQWCHLANMTEPYMFGDNTAFDYLLLYEAYKVSSN